MICVFYVFRKSKRSQMVSIADQVPLLPCSDPKEILRMGRVDPMIVHLRAHCAGLPTDQFATPDQLGRPDLMT